MKKHLLTAFAVLGLCLGASAVNLAWTGQASAIWDDTTLNWVNTNSLAQAAYGGGDAVLFDSRGSASPQVNLAQVLSPSSVTVDADFDYVLGSSSGGQIAGASGLTKRGSGTLSLDTDNSYSGPTVIEAGTLQLGLLSAHGSLGTGPVTNNGALVFNRSDTIVFSNNITGSGSITNLGKTVTLNGTNVYNGNIAVPSGVLLLSGNQTVNSPNVTVTALLGGSVNLTTFGISGGVTVGPGTTLLTFGTIAAGDFRVKINSTTGSNIWNGPIILSGAGGSGVNQIQVQGTTTRLEVNGPISSTDGYSSPGSLLLRGIGTGILGGTVTLPGVFVNKTDAGIWTVNSTGNNWSATLVALGTLRVGATDALPTGLGLQMGQPGVALAALDLAGFNQQIGTLQDGAGGTTIITNSSSTSDSTLTVSSGPCTFSGLIKDGLTHKTGLTLNGGVLTLRSNSTYSGATTIAGFLTLSGDGAIPNSAVISLAAGSTLDASVRIDGTLTLAATQTLKGDGAFNVLGNLVNNGVVELKLKKTGATLSNDSVQGVNQITYGGTLNLILSGDALNTSDSFKLFTATSYSPSAFSSIVPAVPSSGFAWDTSTLATDGTLRIVSVNLPSVTRTFQSGTNVIFNGTGGTADATYYVLSSTNVAAPLATWTKVQTNQFDASGNFSVTNAIAPGVSQNFYLLQVP